MTAESASLAPIWPDSSAFLSYFPDSFEAARSAWLGLAERAGRQATSRTFDHPMTGPGNEMLATDSLWLGAVDAPRVVVLISGTHGVEGYAGSGVQAYLLDGICRAQIDIPADCAVLFVHALTPWGMAWCRRCDEQGIDLNRHFVDLENPPQNSDFAKVQACLAHDDARLRAQALAALARELGRTAYELAVSGGQYVDPRAPFYGGTKPNHGRCVIESLIADHQLFQRELCVLDLHTGLGPWGYGELICDHPPESAGTRAARRRFGDAITEPALGTSSSVPKHGLLDYAWHSGMNDQSCFLTLEFGTYSTQALFETVIADHHHWAHQRPVGGTDAAWQAARRSMLDHFYPADPDWRQSIALRSLQVLRRALAAP